MGPPWKFSIQPPDSNAVETQPQIDFFDHGYIFHFFKPSCKMNPKYSLHHLPLKKFRLGYEMSADCQ
jgi:hypothetical protein